jgi:threonine dehydrogenase-like Zn-dependent dehydrogenase
VKALCWMGKEKLEVQTVPDPSILNPNDAIPTMQPGDILGHEFMGIVEEVGASVKKFKRGDRVVVPFTIACGNCFFCQSTLWGLCDNSNPNASLAEKMYGYSGSALYGYSHIYGGYAGGQAQYARVPFADVGPIKIENDLPDEKLLFLTDIFPTGYMAAEDANIKEGDTVAIWGAGPVGIFAAASAFMFGAKRVISIDRFPDRLALAAKVGAETLDYSKHDVLDSLRELTGGVGPDGAIDAVGLEAHSASLSGYYDSAKMALKLSTDRPTVLRQAIQAVRKGGTVSIPGVYGGLLDKVPFGAAFGKGITMKMGQTHMMRYLQPLLGRIENNEIDPSFIISHRIGMEEIPDAFRVFRDKEYGCTKVVIDPWAEGGRTGDLVPKGAPTQATPQAA